MTDLTRGHFNSNFEGCVRNVVVMGQKVEAAMADDEGVDVSGLNVDECSE